MNINIVEAMLILFQLHHYKKDTSVTFWAKHIFFCHTYGTSMTIIVTKHGIIIDVVGSYFYEKNHDRKWAFRPGRAEEAAA